MELNRVCIFWVPTSVSQTKSSCRVIHARPTINGNGISEIVSPLFSLKQQLETEFHFDGWGVALDGDSCFNTLYHAFHLGWIDAFQDNPQVFAEMSARVVVISNPLHLMKRTRDR
jgi:hypothetical protein